MFKIYNRKIVLVISGSGNQMNDVLQNWIWVHPDLKHLLIRLPVLFHSAVLGCPLLASKHLLLISKNAVICTYTIYIECCFFISCLLWDSLFPSTSFYKILAGCLIFETCLKKFTSFSNVMAFCANVRYLSIMFSWLQSVFLLCTEAHRETFTISFSKTVKV